MNFVGCPFFVEPWSKSVICQKMMTAVGVEPCVSCHQMILTEVTGGYLKVGYILLDGEMKVYQRYGDGLGQDWFFLVEIGWIGCFWRELAFFGEGSVGFDNVCVID